MALDGLTIRALSRELGATLPGARIRRIYQPRRADLLFHIYGAGGEQLLLLSCDPLLPRVHFVPEAPPNPPSPPPFCMVLRKHLEGARFRGVEQPGFERLLRFTLEPPPRSRAEHPSYTLVAELTGTLANLVLLDAAGQIVDALRRTAESQYRIVLPRASYLPPPPQERTDPCTVDEETLGRRLLPGPPAPGRPLYRLLMEALAGFGPLSAREALHRANLDPEAAAPSLPPSSLATLTAVVRTLAVQVAAGELEPALALDTAGRSIEVSPFPLTHLPPGQTRSVPSVLDGLVAVERERVDRERFQRRRASLGRLVATALARARRKLERQEAELAEAEQPESYREMGNLLLAQLGKVPPGAREAVLEDYYHPGRERIVPLDPALTPAQNADRLFHHYRRMVSRREHAARQLSTTREELEQLEALEIALELAEDDDDLDDVEEILASLAPRSVPATPARPSPAGARTRPGGRPLRFRSSDGLLVLVGKSARQNQQLLRLAGPDDLWLHAKDLPGAHVIVRAGEAGPIPPTTVVEAAHLAAFFSKGRGGGPVPVDYTLRRYVRRPKGAPPGKVVYDRQETLFVTPDPARVEQLREPPPTPGCPVTSAS